MSITEELGDAVALRQLRTLLEVYLLPQLRQAAHDAPPQLMAEEPLCIVRLGLGTVQKLVEAITTPMPTTVLSEALAPFLQLAQSIPATTPNELPIAGLPLGAYQGSGERPRVTVADLRRLQQVVG
jgi:hypothetical protein